MNSIVDYPYHLSLITTLKNLIRRSTRIDFQLAKEKVSRLVHSIQIEPFKDIDFTEEDDEQVLTTEFT
jgi:hypothetical protein